MAWEIRDTVWSKLIVAPTELEAWLQYFDFQGRWIDGYKLLSLINSLKPLDITAIEVQ